MAANQIVPDVEVGIVEIDQKLRRYKSALIDGTPGMCVVWECESAKDAVEAFRRQSPIIVLVSLFLSDMPGTELIRKIRMNWPASRPILQLPKDQSLRVFEYLEAGAFGYLPTPYPADELIRAIWTVHEGGAVLDIPAAIAVVEHFRARGAVLDCLTERERQVLICMCEGLSGDEVVEKFGFTKETLRTHVRNVLGKLGAHSAAQAVALYLNPKAQMATPGTHHLPSEVEHNRFVPAGNICRFPSQSPVIDAPLSLRSSPKQKFINLEK